MMYGIYKINFRPPNSGGECFFSSHEYILYSECGESQRYECLLSCLHQTTGYIDKHSIRIILMCEIFQALHRILFGHIFCYYFKCGPWDSSNTITLNFVKNGDSQSRPRPSEL